MASSPSCWSPSRTPPCFKSLQRQLPLVLIDAHEMIALAGLQKRYALAHQRVRDNHARLRALMTLGGIERCHHSIEVIAVDALHEPAERPHLFRKRLEAHHLLGGPIGLL